MAFLKVNGAEAASPSEMRVEVVDVGAFEQRSASGRLVADRAAVKRRLTLRWSALSPAQLGAMLGAVGEGFFEATYPDPVDGTPRTMSCRCSKRMAGVLLVRGGEPVWTDVEMEWTER